jgi:hypothetical protein
MGRSREQTWWYLSGPNATYAVVTDHWRIVDAAPIAKKFIGKTLDELTTKHNFDVVECMEKRRRGSWRKT